MRCGRGSRRALLALYLRVEQSARKTPATVGNSRALKHGYRSEGLVKAVEAEVRELMDALAESAPVRDPDGGLPGADVVAIEAAARALKRWRHVSAWCDLARHWQEQNDA